jgi:phosphoglycolate phosphatase
VIRLVVLDLAGTMVRDDGVVEQAYLDAVTAVKGDLTDEQRSAMALFVRDTMGQPDVVVLRGLLRGDAAQVKKARAVLQHRLSYAIARGEMEPLPGADTALYAFRAMGTRVCLATGLSGDVCDQVVDAAGWRDLIDLTISSETRVRGRPHPGLITAARNRLDVRRPADVAVAGDSEHDLVAGSRAGAQVVAGVLTGAHSRARLAEAPHTHLLRAIDELPQVVAGVA